jgi:hypothetical protein
VYMGDPLGLFLCRGYGYGVVIPGGYLPIAISSQHQGQAREGWWGKEETVFRNVQVACIRGGYVLPKPYLRVYRGVAKQWRGAEARACGRTRHAEPRVATSGEVLAWVLACIRAADGESSAWGCVVHGEASSRADARPSSVAAQTLAWADGGLDPTECRRRKGACQGGPYGKAGRRRKGW